MRRLLYFIAFSITFSPLSVTALAGPEARFDWPYGQPQIVANATATCNNETTARFDWVLGQPGIAFDATATCAGVNPQLPKHDIFWFD